MKKHLIMAALLLSCCLTSFGQQQVTTFMGMPVDGLKKNMSHQLVEKGFRRVPGEDCLEGEFNGENVYIHIQTVKNKVWRIVVSDKSSRDEAQIKVRFNNLCYQFKNNERYTSFGDKEQTIPEDEDIGYEMEVKNKRYQATFYQDDDHVMTEEEGYSFAMDFIEKKYGLDSLTIKELQKGNDADINKMDTAAIRKFMTNGCGMSAEQCFNSTPEELDSLIKKGSGRLVAEIIPEALKFSLEKFNRSVWFTIIKNGNRYYLAIFYENEYNQANGEDL